jgi:hypothetical protein
MNTISSNNSSSASLCVNLNVNTSCTNSNEEYQKYEPSTTGNSAFFYLENEKEPEEQERKMEVVHLAGKSSEQNPNEMLIYGSNSSSYPSFSNNNSSKKVFRFNSNSSFRSKQLVSSASNNNRLKQLKPKLKRAFNENGLSSFRSKFSDTSSSSSPNSSSNSSYNTILKAINKRKLKLSCPLCSSIVLNMSDHLVKKHMIKDRFERKSLMDIVRKNYLGSNDSAVNLFLSDGFNEMATSCCENDQCECNINIETRPVPILETSEEVKDEFENANDDTGKSLTLNSSMQSVIKLDFCLYRV